MNKTINRLVKNSPWIKHLSQDHYTKEIKISGVGEDTTPVAKAKKEEERQNFGDSIAKGRIIIQKTVALGAKHDS